MCQYYHTVQSHLKRLKSSLPVCVVSGVLYLQYGEETKQVRMPARISSQDTLRALFVTAFPHQLTMNMLHSPNMAIYVKDASRNIYYDLQDIRWGPFDVVISSSTDVLKFTDMCAS